MLKDVINAELSTEDENLVIQQVGEIQTKFPFLIGLTSDERMKLPKMGRKTLDFVEKALIHGKEHADKMPPYVDTAGMERDMVLFKQIRRLLSNVAPFVSKLMDTEMRLGAEAYAMGRVIYNTVKGAAKAGVPGMQTIANDLAKQYRKQFSSSSDQGNASETETPAETESK